jgi:hypothetical protein
MRWVEHIACMHTKFQSENLNGGGHLGEPDVNDIKIDFKDRSVKAWIGFM